MSANDIDSYCDLESATPKEVRYSVESSILDHAKSLIAYPYHLRGIKMEPAYKQVDEDGDVLYWQYSGKLPSGILVILTIYND